MRDLEPIRRADAALLNRATLTTSQRNPARKEHLIEAASLELPLDTSTSVDAPVRDGESMMCAVSDEIDADSKVVVRQVEISNEGFAVLGRQGRKLQASLLQALRIIERPRR